MIKITEDTVLAEILQQPGAEEILMNHGLPCLHCPMAVYELGDLKLEEVAKKYGLDFKKIKKELEGLNQPRTEK